MQARKLTAELLGTALLVFIGAGVATVSFGFDMAESSPAAGILAVAFAFGFVMLILAYAIGPISGAHINPAVTIGFLLSRRISLADAAGYWIAQVIGAIIGAAVLLGVVSNTPNYSTKTVGLGADGYGASSMVHLGAGGAFLVEVVLTFVFVFVVLVVTRKAAWPQLGGVAIGLALGTVHLLGVALTGTSVNPARSIGPALFVGGEAISQLWLFILAPLVGGALAALVNRYFYPTDVEGPEITAREEPVVAD
ncbi:MAG: aquaporin [Micrococcales bacterium]|nr:aquaporin [Micrococcales bacterium]